MMEAAPTRCARPGCQSYTMAPCPSCGPAFCVEHFPRHQHLSPFGGMEHTCADDAGRPLPDQVAPPVPGMPLAVPGLRPAGDGPHGRSRSQSPTRGGARPEQGASRPHPEQRASGVSAPHGLSTAMEMPVPAYPETEEYVQWRFPEGSKQPGTREQMHFLAILDSNGWDAAGYDKKVGCPSDHLCPLMIRATRRVNPGRDGKGNLRSCTIGITDTVVKEDPYTKIRAFTGRRPKEHDQRGQAVRLFAQGHKEEIVFLKRQFDDLLLRLWVEKEAEIQAEEANEARRGSVRVAV